MVNRRLLGLFGALLWASSVAHAADRVALLIGNNGYKDESAKLVNAANDAHDLSLALERLGFKVLLRQDASATAMRDAVREFGRELEGASIALFFYAGHALQFQGNNYLLPISASPSNESDVLLDGMDVGNIIYVMGSAKTKNIIILDACRDNPFADRFRTSVGLAQSSAPPDTLIAYSTAPNAVASDGAGRNSLYTKHLLRFIESSGDDILTVFSKVGDAVAQETRGQPKKQVPWLLSSLRPGSTLGAARATPATVAANAPAKAPQQPVERTMTPTADTQLNAERAFWESLDKTRKEELNEYLELYPKGLFAKLAQRRLDALAQATAATPAPARVSEPALVTPAPITPAAAAAAPVGAAPIAESTPTPTSPASAASNAVVPLPATPAPSATTKPVAAPNITPTAAAAPGKPVEAPKSPSTAAKVQPSAPPAAAKPAPAPPKLAAAMPSAGDGAANDSAKLRFPDGSSYIGGLLGGVPSGTGSYLGADGYRYDGEFAAGRPAGRGIAQWPDGNSFDGQFANGAPNGTGILRTKRGDAFDGVFKDGVIQGVAKIKFAVGDSYEGEVVNGLPSGKGRFDFANGDVYTGELINGALTGRGTLKKKSGDLYEGVFLDGRVNGQALLKMSSGDLYRGEFKDHVFAGRGRYDFADGTRYEGEFLNGEINGKGVLTYVDGRRFEGQFERGLRNARGAMINETGRRVDATITDGLLQTVTERASSCGAEKCRD